MQEALRSLIMADAAVVSAVDTRVSWGTLPRGNSLPAIVLHFIDGAPDYTTVGESGLSNARVQADCWGKTYAESVSVARAVNSAVSGFGGDHGGVSFQGIFIDSERDLSEDGTNDVDVFFRISIDFTVWYTS